MHRLVATAIGVTLLAAACSSAGSTTSASTTSAPTPPATAPATTAPATTTSAPAANPWDQTVADAIGDLEDYWGQVMPELYGIPYAKVSGGFYPYTSTSPSPPCGDPPPRYDEIADNAFYCRTADLVAWDNEALLPGLYEQFGPFTIAIVFAHEWGHAIQQRAGVTGPTILLEQQADCFAGAWVASVANGHSSRFTLTLPDLDAALAGYLQLRDSPETLSVDPQAHGTGFDRVAAFQEGFLDGAHPCADYPAHPRPLVELPQPEQAGLATTQLGEQQVEEAAVQDLEDFWSKAAPELGFAWTPVHSVQPYDPNGTPPTCGGSTFTPEQVTRTAFYCIDDDYVAWDEANLMPDLYQEIGGFSVAALVANQYSLAAMVRLGVPTTDAESFNLEADCLTGSWVSSLILHDRTSQVLTLAPQDLDQVLIAFLAYGDAPSSIQASDGQHGTAFQRVAALRDGVFNGWSKCATYSQGGGPGTQP
jgi:predicted metalloprotease